MPINANQLNLYRREWGAARKVLRARGLEPIDADRERHACHLRALGKDKSSLSFSNADLDKVLQEFRAISRPDDLAPQMNDQAKRRKFFVIDKLCRQLGAGREYAEGIARGMNREGTQKTSYLDDMDDAGLKKVLVALTMQVKRKKPAAQPDDAALEPEDDPDICPF